MNHLRTNETKRVGDLISSALLNAIGPKVTNNFAPPKSKNTFKVKVEEGDPVRSAERVPYSSSHQLSSLTSTGEGNFSQGEKTNVAAA